MRTVRSGVSWPSRGPANWPRARSPTGKAKRKRKRVGGRSSAGGRRVGLPGRLHEKPTRESGGGADAAGGAGAAAPPARRRRGGGVGGAGGRAAPPPPGVRPLSDL